MDQERIAQLRVLAAGHYQQGRDRLARMPAKARFMLGLFLLATAVMALHAALSGKDASL